MTLRTRIGIALAGLVIPFTAMAVAPGPVVGVKAVVQHGSVVVSWTPVNDAHVTSYNVYLSHASILKNNGAYDDFQTADAAKSSITLDRLPPVQTLYISILARNDSAEESAFFAEETSVDVSGLSGAASSLVSSDSSVSLVSSDSSVSSSISGEPHSLRLLSAEAVSATGVLLTFSETVKVDGATAAQAFSVKNGSGVELALTRLVIKGNTVLLNTVPQERSTVYVVRIGTGVSGFDGSGATFAMDAIQPPMLFTGHPTGTASEQASSAASSAQRADITDLVLQSEPEKNGFSTVIATWKSPMDDGVAGLSISQSMDGASYTTPSLVNKSVQRANIPHVPAGMFTLFIKVRFADGSVSRGMMRSITVKGAGVPPADGTSSHLPKSGSGAFLAILLTSAVAGYGTVRRLSLKAA